ncbi:MAG: CapA family protein, partial [candidate division WOR-3 bacterium]
AAWVDELGEAQGFGLIAGTDTLLYAFAGSERLEPERWVTVYQGAFPLRTWNSYQLPVGADFLARFGHLNPVTHLVFINDRDTDPRASIYFDDILNITEDLPVAPEVEVWYTIGPAYKNRDGTWNVTVHFYSRVIDPDSPTHDYYWAFGDDSTSTDSCPVHTYIVRDDHDYTVLLRVRDSTGLWGHAACRVRVDPGPTTFPVRMNFVGDIMLARRYELPGGIIDTLGPEGIFDPTLPWLGAAADITVANLESPLTAQGTRHPTKPIVFRGRPSNVRGIAHAGIDVVSLANNHIIDYGLEGMRETQESLAARQIGHSGAGANSYEAYLPLFWQKNGLNLAFLAYSDRTGQDDNYQPHLNSGYNKPGFANLDTFHLFRQLKEVDSIADLTVVEFHTGEEYAPAPEDGDDEFYSRFALVPDSGTIRLRHRAIDQGADLVVGHHPHVLQGFEVYKGRLIAHSLGNFCFDQEFPETYPSVILNGAVDETGFYEFSITPVYIDDYIPRRANGELGCHILDYLARRSRELNTYLLTDRESVAARIVLDTGALLPTVYHLGDEVLLHEENGWWVSDLLPLPRNGSISRVVAATPSRNWQFRLGRDVIWFGNFEDEGATMWLLNQPDEFYDTLSHRGRRSLCQLRPAGSDSIVTNLEERLPCYSDSSSYTLYSWLKTANAESATVTVRFYATRTGSVPIGTARLRNSVSGTTDWRLYHNEFVPAANTQFIDLCLKSSAPRNNEGRVWFDDVGVIEWDRWQPLTSSVAITEPNDYYWIQLRTELPTTSALLFYEETGYGPLVPVTRPAEPESGPLTLLSYPNPARSGITLQFQLAYPTHITLRIYNILGQKVRTLVNDSHNEGLKTIFWDGKDDRGKRVGSGTYFCRLQTNNTCETTGCVLLTPDASPPAPRARN